VLISLYYSNIRIFSADNSAANSAIGGGLGSSFTCRDTQWSRMSSSTGVRRTTVQSMMPGT